ncbi:MAG: hypothetical protein U0K70_05000 [Acutalibacteraceae bacterium]|nr:hypothetical protein [Acutalibacteraceae bacterium]
MKNLFEEPYIEVVRFPADVFTTTVQSPDPIIDGDESAPEEEL